MNAIVLEGVSKKFLFSRQSDSGIKGLFSSIGRRTTEEFWALNDINMEIKKGSVVGVIGRNGAGKTTLLDIITGICMPTTGNLTINGKVSSILTLGAGFQGELTGKENIYLNSSILGMTKEEVNKKYFLIAEFSELGSFLDSPVQTYSNGMYLRLGFSIAVHMDFDILLIDEVLSVGDVSFQKKCFDKIEEFRKAGKTMVISTQDIDIINRMCDEVFLLERGRILESGDPQKVTGRYLSLLNEEKNLSETFQRKYDEGIKWWADKRFWGKREGSREAEIIGVEIINSQGMKTHKVISGEKVILTIYFQTKKEIKEPHFGVAIFREDGVYCYGPNILFDGYRIDKVNEGKGWFSIEYESLFLMPGYYRFSIGIWDKTELWAYDYRAGFYKFEIIGKHVDGQLLNLNPIWNPDNGLQEIKAFSFGIQTKGFNLNHEHSTADIVVSPVDLLDSEGKLKDNFCSNERIEIKLNYESLKSHNDVYLWIGIFRSDDIYCHGAFKILKEENGSVSLIYPSLPLLKGKYYLSVGLWSIENKELLFYSHKVRQFKMSSAGKDHGTVYLRHKWAWELP